MERMGDLAGDSMHIAGSYVWKFCQCMRVPHPPLRVDRFSQAVIALPVLMT